MYSPCSQNCIFPMKAQPPRHRLLRKPMNEVWKVKESRLISQQRGHAKRETPERMNVKKRMGRTKARKLRSQKTILKLRRVLQTSHQPQRTIRVTPKVSKSQGGNLGKL